MRNIDVLLQELQTGRCTSIDLSVAPDVSTEFLSNEQVTQLTVALRTSQCVTELNLSRQVIKGSLLRELLDATASHPLLKLSLCGMTLSPSTLGYVANYLREAKTPLTILNLSNIMVSKPNARFPGIEFEPLLKALATHQTLTSLNLAGSGIGSGVLKRGLTVAMATNTALKLLNLDRNDLRGEALVAIVQAVARNSDTQLETLSIKANVNLQKQEPFPVSLRKGWIQPIRDAQCSMSSPLTIEADDADIGADNNAILKAPRAIASPAAASFTTRVLAVTPSSLPPR